MKRIYTLFITFALIGNLSSQNYQTPFVSELFSNTLSKNIHSGLDTKPYTNIYTTFDSMLFVVHQRGFKKKTESAKVYKINTFTGTEETYSIPIPRSFIENGGKIEHIWIWALAANDSLLCVAADEEIWIYHYTTSKQYEYLKSISIENISSMEMNNNILHAFVKNNEGFDWLKINLSNNEVVKLKPLVLKNHFFLQIGPGKIISIRNNALYLLQQSRPAIEKYSLSGELLAEYLLEIPNWRKIPEEVAQKLDSIEDETERNYALPQYSVFDNNFMHLFYTFPCERFFMIAIDKNVANNTYITPYFIQIIGDTTIVEPYTVKLNENEKFDSKHFPFLTEAAEGNFIFAQLNECVIQLNRSTNVSWHNKTQKEFNREVNIFHRDNDPIEKIETYRFVKNYIPIDSLLFLDYDDALFSLNDVKKEKAVFIISQYPQCATCAKIIWNYFSNINMTNLQLYNVTLDCPTYLIKKEKIKEVSMFLKAEHTHLFIDSKTINSATKQILAQKANPIVVLFDKKLQHIEVISTTNIIADLMGNLKPEFLHTIENFMEN